MDESTRGAHIPSREPLWVVPPRVGMARLRRPHTERGLPDRRRRPLRIFQAALPLLIELCQWSGPVDGERDRLARQVLPDQRVQIVEEQLHSSNI